MSTTYKIHRWDPILLNNSVNPIPIIYIKPDKALIEFAKINDNVLAVNINGSDSIYDNKKIFGQFKPSYEVPNCRCNYFHKTGFFVIILSTSPWYSYPTLLGECQVFGLKGNIKAPQYPLTIC